MPSFPTNINPLSALLERRHLTAAEGALMGLEISRPEAAERDLKFFFRGPVKHLEKLPYHDLDGAPLIDPKLGSPFVRYRIERPEGYQPPINPDIGANGKPVKSAKYLSPKGSSIFVYAPRVDGFNWPIIAADTHIPIIITEGEFKAYAVCKTGNPCLGLMGVQCFGKTSDPFPAPFDQFEHLKREYYIVFDADKESDRTNTLKVEVAQAAIRLGTKLGMAGGQVYMLHIAASETFRKAREKDPDCKMGIDDYLEAGGTIDALIADATLAESCQDMVQLRAKYAFYTGTKPHIINVLNGYYYTCSSFIKELEVNRIRLVPIKGGFKSISVADEFMKSRDRPEVDKKVFWPDEAPGYDAEGRTFNEWTGFGTEPMAILTEEDRSFYNAVVGDFKKLVKGIFEEYDEYHYQWAGHMIQRPGEKTSIAMLVASVHNGIGKSLLGEIYRGVIGIAHSVALEMDRTVAQFNKQLGAKILLQIDEADGRFDGNESKLKDLITSDTTPIELKGIDIYMVDNFVRLFLTSNSSAPIRLDAENRRFFVCGPTMTSVYAKETWQPWVNSVAKRLKSTAGLRAIHLFLSKVDLSGWDPMARVLETPQMLNMVGASRSKNNTVLDGMYEDFQESPTGLWLITPALKGQAVKLLSDLVDLVKIGGGNTMAYDGTYKGTKLRGTILDRDRKLPRKKNSQSAFILDSCSGFSSDDAFKASVDANRSYQAWKDTALPGSTKM
jgi:hypothetical protein